MWDIDTIKTVADMGLGSIALYYAHQVGSVLKKHEGRLKRLEKRGIKGRK